MYLEDDLKDVRTFQFERTVYFSEWKKKGNHLAETEEMSYEGVEYFDSSTLVANAIHLWLFCLIAFSSSIPITSPKVLFPAFSSCISLLYQWRDGYKQVRPILSTLGASFASMWFFVFLKLSLKRKIVTLHCHRCLFE